MKLCVIGNSHVAMLIAALRDRAGDAPPLDVSWFAKPGLAEGEARLDGRLLVATDPDLRARLDTLGTPGCLDLGDFDGVVFVGGTASAFGAVRMLQDHRVSGWASAQPLIEAAEAALGPPLKHPLISGPAYVAALAGTITQNLTWQLATALREASGVPICVIPQPFPSEQILDTGKKYPLFRRIAREGDGASLAACLRRAHDAAFADIPALRVFAQPTETVVQGCMTAPAYTRDAVRLNLTSKLPAEDVLHAGPKLGARYLELLPAAIRSMENSS